MQFYTNRPSEARPGWGLNALLYNVLFIAPLIVIMVLFYRGMQSEVIEKWVKKFKPYMRLMTGLLLIGLAAWMLVFALV